MIQSPPNEVVRVVKIAAKPDTIFAFFTDPEKMVRWKGLEATLEVKPGGMYRINMNNRDIARGQYVEIVPFRRVVFTWGWEGEGSGVPPGSSTVEISLEPDGDQTTVRLRHYGLPTSEACEQHAQGWDHYLERLSVAASGGEPGPDPWLAAS